MFVYFLNDPNIYFSESVLIQTLETQKSAGFPFGDVYI